MTKKALLFALCCALLVWGCSKTSSPDASNANNGGADSSVDARPPGMSDATPSDDTNGTDDPDGSGDGPDADLPPTGPLGNVTVTLTTASEDEEVANAAGLQLCLTESVCFDLVRPHRDNLGKREAGPLQFDVHNFEEVALRHEDVDRFELRASTPAEFTPHCLAVSFDGRPALCTTAFDGPIGSSILLDDSGQSGCVSCFRRGDETDMRITHGPFVGARDAQKKEARVWVRTDASRPVELWVGESPEMADARLADTQTARPEDDFTTELQATGLEPGRTYYYRLTVDGLPHAPQEHDQYHPGGVYTLQMPPAAGTAAEFSFALGSCSRMFKHGNYDAVRDSEPAFLLMVGDYHYGNVLQVHFEDAEPTPYDPMVVAKNELRWWYRSAHWEKPSLLATVPMLNTWDDHDYGGGEAYADGEALGKDLSRQAMLEYFANPTRAENPNDRATYFRYSHGDVDFFVLDSRWHRPRLCFDGGGRGEACDPNEDPLGEAQTDWLLDQLQRSDATFKMIATGTRFYGGGPKAWTPFLIARDRMLQRIVDADIGGVMFLSGGPHSSQYQTFTAAGRTWHEIVSSPLSAGLGTCSAGLTACYDEIKNFLMVDVDTTADDPTVSARIVTFDGEKPWPGGADVTIRRSALN